MIGQTVSHYRILEKLGEGGMGIVYLAEDTHLGRRVAIKFPSSTSSEHNFRARFPQESRAASALNHPNIAAIYDYGETDDAKPFIVMELVEGKSLDTLLYENKLTMSRTIEIIEDVARALGEAHSRSVIHRDIKPSNIVINNRDQVKVLDFGLAKHLNEEQVRAAADPEARTLLAARTQSGTVVGTPLYLSPEQARGASVDARSDLFALGAVLYECIAGKPAFSGAGVMEIAANIIHIDPPPPSTFNSNVSPELDRVTLKALAKQPSARHQSADELIADLNAAKSALRERALSHTHTQRILAAPETGRTSALATISDLFRRPRLSIGVALSVLLVAGLIVWLVRSSLRPVPHQPSADAQRWYDQGTNAMRDGAYYKASKALERAIAIDDRFALAHARLAEAWTELDYSDKAKDETLIAERLVPDRSILPQIDALYLDAVTATVTRDFNSAIKSYAEIVRLRPDDSQAYVDLGRAYEKNEETEKAIENYQKATSLDANNAAAYLRLAALYGRKQELASANAAFDKAETLYQDTSNYEGITETRYQRATVLSKIGKLEEAYDQLQKALDSARVTDNLYQRVNILLQLSSVSYFQDQTAQAKQYANEAINLAQSNNLESLTARGLVDLGNAFYVRREYGNAEQYFKQALDLARRSKGRRAEAMALLSLGKLYIQQDKNRDEALRYVEQALGFFQQGGYSKEVSQALLLRGQAKLQAGDFDGALQEFKQQLEFARRMDDPPQLARSHILIGNLLADQELYPEALSHFEESYKINQSLGQQLNIGYSLADRANMLWRLGRYEEARDALSQVPAIAESLDSDYRQVLLAMSHLINAQMALSQRQFLEAKTEAERSLSIAGTRLSRTATEAEYTLGLAQSLSGTARQGRLTCENAVKMAKEQSDPRMLSDALLALAESLLESGDRQGALATALEAQERFARFRQEESEWHALLIAGRAAVGTEGATAQEYFVRANNLLLSFQQKWGAEAFDGYLRRPDVQFYRQQLDRYITTQ